MIYKDGQNILTNLDYELIEFGTKEKNHIDDENNMHVTDNMTQLFINSSAIQPMDVFFHKEQLAFELIHKSALPIRPISKQEYEALPKCAKDKKTVIPHGLLNSLPFALVFSIFLILYIYVILFCEYERNVFWMLTGILAFVATICLSAVISSIHHQHSHLIFEDSHISAGNVTLFYGKTYTTGIGGVEHFIDVAFYEDKKLVRKLPISEDVYNILTLDSRVIIYENTVYAYDEQGKLIA